MNPFSVKLNLPEAEIKLRQGARGVEIHDPLRRRWLVLKPEEWVRQHFVAFLNAECGVPLSRMANEVSINLNGTSKRCDTVIYDASLRPVCIVEYKAPNVSLSLQTIEQIARYNLVLGVPWLIVSNGLRHFSMSSAGGSVRLSDHIPSFREMVENN